MGGNNPLTTYVISIVSSLFGAVLAVRMFGHWGKSEWGKMATCLIGAAIAAYCIFKPNRAIEVLTVLGTKIASVFPT
ncbi:TcpD family membrane protein [Streptomyces sp. NPDC053474]|uniref:TcpD family membrane protein n=1 Tax=Streptomyces sp. NPDC053474 TaxID=3365704 RepID=UPI0037CE1E8A